MPATQGEDMCCNRMFMHCVVDLKVQTLYHSFPMSCYSSMDQRISLKCARYERPIMKETTGNGA